MDTIFGISCDILNTFTKALFNLFGRESAILRVHVQHFKNDSTNGWRGFDVSRFWIVGFIFG